MTESGPAPSRILLTGAAGFVGRHLIAALRRQWPQAELQTPETDIRDAAAMAAMVQSAAPDCVVHLAAISSIMHAAQDQSQAWAVNLHGALHVAHAILAHAPACQMLFVSSADAYGASFRAGVALDETAALAPMNIYGATKAAADLALGALATQGLRVVRLRAFNHIGPGQSPDFVVASFARQLARIEKGLQPPVLDVGRLDTFRDFLDVRDVCAAYVACIGRREALPPGTILNIASGHPRRVGDVLNDLISIAGVTAEVRTETPRVRDTDILNARGNASKAETLLAWAPKISWPDTLRGVLQDWRARVDEG